MPVTWSQTLLADSRNRSGIKSRCRLYPDIPSPSASVSSPPHPSTLMIHTWQTLAMTPGCLWRWKAGSDTPPHPTPIPWWYTHGRHWLWRRVDSGGGKQIQTPLPTHPTPIPWWYIHGRHPLPTPPLSRGDTYMADTGDDPGLTLEVESRCRPHHQHHLE